MSAQIFVLPIVLVSRNVRKTIRECSDGSATPLGFRRYPDVYMTKRKMSGVIDNIKLLLSSREILSSMSSECKHFSEFPQRFLLYTSTFSIVCNDRWPNIFCDVEVLLRKLGRVNVSPSHLQMPKSRHMASVERGKD